MTRRSPTIGNRGLVGMFANTIGLVAWILTGQPFNGLMLFFCLGLLLSTYAAFWGLGLENKRRSVNRIVEQRQNGRVIDNMPIGTTFRSAHQAKQYSEENLRDLRMLNKR